MPVTKEKQMNIKVSLKKKKKLQSPPWSKSNRHFIIWDNYNNDLRNEIIIPREPIIGEQLCEAFV